MAKPTAFSIVKIKIMISLVICFSFVNTTLASPNSITFQSRIVKPDGLPLEAASVNFRISLTDTVGSCVIYQEDFNNRNMAGNKGLINLAIGSGTQVFPVAAMTLAEVFNNYNSPTLNCQAGGSIVAGATDRRKLIVQFNDGSGWQTVPAMDINSTPFALQAVSANRLGDFAAADYVRTATFPTCVGGEALHFNGASFTCVAVGGGAGTVTSVTSANTDIAVATTTTTPVLTLNAATTGANKILRLKNDGTLDAISGVNLTNLNASALASGTVAAARMPALTGDVTMTAGTTATTIANDAITNTHVAAAAAIARSKFATGTANHVLVNDGITGAMSSIGCNNGELIKWAAGVPTCSADATGAGDIVNGGNTTGAAVVVGTNDAQSLRLETNNAVAMTILSDGNVGVGTTSPAYLLDVGTSSNGIPPVNLSVARFQNTTAATNDNATEILFAANRTTGGLTNVAAISGMITDITNAAYKGALIFSTADNAAPTERMRIDNNGLIKITGKLQVGSNNTASGTSSLASGSSNTASGNYSVAIGGMMNTASGMHSITLGQFNTSSASTAVSIGISNTASAVNSTAIGYNNIASGIYSTGLGNSTTAESYNQLTIGRYNLPLGTETPGSWVSTDPLFVIGNGSGGGASRANALMVLKNGNVGVGTSGPNAKLDVNQTVAGSAAFLAESGGTNFLRILNPAGGITNSYNAADAVLYVGSDTISGRSINASGTINASGADFAEWVDWPSAEVPEMGSVVLFKGGYVVVSSPTTAAFVGNDNNKFQNPILVAFAGQLPVLVIGKVQEGDLIVANGDGTASAIPRDQVTMAQARKGVGTAWASSDDIGLKRINVAIGIGLGGNGGREIAAVKEENKKLQQVNVTKTKELSEIKARLDRQEKQSAAQQRELAAIKSKLGL